MNRAQPQPPTPSGTAAPALVVRRTEGDFPHARRRGVKVACCTCTTCCITFIGGGIGALIGLVHGGIRGARNDAYLRASGTTGAVLIRLLAVFAFAFLHGVVGLLIGAAIGFACDMVYFNFLN